MDPVGELADPRSTIGPKRVLEAAVIGDRLSDLASVIYGLDVRLQVEEAGEKRRRI